MHVSKTKFEKKSSLDYYHMTCIGKAKHIQTEEVYWDYSGEGFYLSAR